MAEAPFRWQCPHCDQHQIVTAMMQEFSVQHFNLPTSPEGTIGLMCETIACSNADCRRYTIDIKFANTAMVKGTSGFSHPKIVDNPYVYFSGRVYPEGSARPQADYIPQPIKDDYLEACRIRDLSPKASATLSRRCIQGMIRDFAGISKPSLYQEIEALLEQVENHEAPQGVSNDSVEALHDVRSIGNIGAHMERDIDLIVSVDPDEAQILIELIESLFEEWYVARHKRRERFSKLSAIANDKQLQKKLPKPNDA